MISYIASATYRDPYMGNLQAFLKPQRRTRRGEAVVQYRWFTERGLTCDGLAHGHNACVHGRPREAPSVFFERHGTPKDYRVEVKRRSVGGQCRWSQTYRHYAPIDD